MIDRSTELIRQAFDHKVAIGLTGTGATGVASQTLEQSIISSSDLLTFFSVCGGALTCIYMIASIYTKIKDYKITQRIKSQEIELNNMSLKRRSTDQDNLE